MHPNSVTRRVLTGAVAAGVVGAVLVTNPVAAPASPSAAQARHDQRRDLRVMTLNLYLGGSLGDAIKKADKGIMEFLKGAAEVYNTAQATNFPKRANWIAGTIKDQRPDVLVLNELTHWVATSTTGAKLPNYDFLTILQQALRRKGLNYQVASLNHNADIGYSPTVGIPYYDKHVPGCDDAANLLACQLRLKDRDAILYNTRASGLRQLNGLTHRGIFRAQQTFTVAGQTLSFRRGWTSAGFRFQGRSVTVLGSHLEAETQDGKKGRYGPKNWPSKVQVAQGQELTTVAKTLAKDTGGRLMLVGDLNTDANGYYSATYANLVQNYFQDSWAQVGKGFGPGVGATCCQAAALGSSLRLDSFDPPMPTRIDLILTRGVEATWARRLGTAKMSRSQPKWQSDHYFYGAHLRL